MLKDNAIWMGTGEKPVNLLLKQANRHGLIAAHQAPVKP
ncbi:unknown [Eggerthella sp. CAG:1427]|nr:unknown [Eggerthella sp. CAG:1427]